MKWKKLWMSGESLSVSQIWPLCVMSSYKEATIEEGQHEVTQFTRRHMTLHFSSFFSREKLNVWCNLNKAQSFQTKSCPRILSILELPEHLTESN